MKCIYCGNDAKYKDRSGRRCPSCHKSFAFDPKAGDKFTDMAFKSAIEAVSGGGRVRWGIEHLYYEICRRRRSRFRWSLVVVAVAAAVLLFLTRWPGFAIVAIVVAGIVLVPLLRSPIVRVDKDTFDSHWQKWVSAHGQPAGVIKRKPAPAQKRQKEPDLEDYSFDRAVICDRARTVDLLLANNFHFENNSAVLSVSGYPPGPFDTVRKMLRRNPRLHVFALHDATPEGCKMAQFLADSPDWFKGQAAITDVGLRPRHRKPFRGLYLAAIAGTRDALQGLTQDELIWLQKYALELAAIRPEQLLKRLYRAINRKTDAAPLAAGAAAGAAGSVVMADEIATEEERKRQQRSGFDIDDSSFSEDAGDSEGGADGFG